MNPHLMKNRGVKIVHTPSLYDLLVKELIADFGQIRSSAPKSGLIYLKSNGWGAVTWPPCVTCSQPMSWTGSARTPIDVGALRRYERPPPTLNDHDRLLVAGEVLQ